MKFEVNIEKKYAYSIIAILLIASGVVIVNAYNTNDPSVFGHSAGEISGLTINGTADNIVFITPKDVYSAVSNAAIGWTTYDASLEIPVDASVVILQADGDMSGPDTGDVTTDVRIRKSATAGDSYLLLRGRASNSGSGGASWSGQGFFPVASDRTFQFTIEDPGFNNGARIRLIGYVEGGLSSGGGSGGTPIVPVYQCPKTFGCDSGASVGGDWVSYGCVGQISTVDNCEQRWWNSGTRTCTNSCTLLGTMLIE